MSSVALPLRVDMRSAADSALKGAARFWFVAAVAGQWAFLYYIAVFYGPSTLQGNFAAWSRNSFLPKGYVAGDTAGNLAFAVHVMLAAVTSLGGALQLIPRIRTRAMFLHRWNGRLFFVTALAVSVSGLYMVWVRNTRANTGTALGITLNAVLIIFCCVVAWRTALRHDASTHRQWALRAYLVANGQWFFRVGLFAWIIVNGGPVGISKGMGGPFPLFWGFACYLLPLAMLELYLHASGPRRRFAIAAALIVLTVLMSIGIFGITMFMWRPMLARL